MKKYILILLAACQGLAISAQDQYKVKFTLKNGTKMVALAEDVEEMTVARVGKAEVTLSERYKTSTSLSVNLDFDANVGKVLACITPAGKPIDNPKDYMEKNPEKVIVATQPYKAAFDFLAPETKYTVYAQAYTKDGYAGELSQMDFTTGKTEDDPFDVTLTPTASSVRYQVSPLGEVGKYMTLVTNRKTYEGWMKEEGANGDIFMHFVAWWKQLSGWYGDTWQNMAQTECVADPTDEVQGHLMWDDEQVCIAFGINQQSELATPVQIVSVKTLKPQKSNMTIGLEVTRNAFRDVAIKATPSSDDAYFVTVQPASWVENYKGDEALLRALCYEANNITPSVMARTRDTDEQEGVWEFRPNKSGEKYYVIACGLDGDAPTTAAFMIEFTLP